MYPCPNQLNAGLWSQWSGDRMLNSSSSAIRILHITDTLSSGGKERQLVELLRGFNRMDGFINELVVLSNVIHYDEVRSLGINIHIFKKSRRWDFRILQELYCLAR